MGVCVSLEPLDRPAQVNGDFGGKVRVLAQLGDYQKAISTMEFLSEEALSAYSAFPLPTFPSCIT